MITYDRKIHDMAMFILGLAIFVLAFEPTQSWRGKYCETRRTSYKRIPSYCYCRINGRCTHWSYRMTAIHISKYYCCNGWTHNGNEDCSIPVCNPSCQNGGTCVQPNQCRCTRNYEGDICAGIAACSSLKPCYPGRCYGSYGYSECMCSGGFGGDSCRKLTSNEYKPVIEMANATLAKYKYTSESSSLQYMFMTDATNSTKNTMMWTNQEDFNDMRFDIDASVNAGYMFRNLPPRPDYIKMHKFGIVGANVKVEHYKINKDGIEKRINSETFHCEGPSNMTPLETLKCRLTNGTNLFQVDSGDRYVLTYTITTGGYRQYSEYPYKFEPYEGIASQSKMEFRFDRDVPVHCSEDMSCHGNQPEFELENDVTKDPLKPRWDGWKDTLSGVVRYSFEVWKMEYSKDYGVLREPNIREDFNPIPEFITSQKAENKTFPVFEPRGPGVYSTILEVADRANNSRYARRIAIFDKTSEITTQDDFPLYVASANKESNYTWQADSGNRITIEAIWIDHFINRVHNDSHFLAEVQHYNPRLSDNIRRINYKKIDKFDDNDGKRSTAAILNINSIVKFEFNYGTEMSAPPLSEWEEVPLQNQRKTKHLTGELIRDGDIRKIWVKAYDIMGNTKIDSAVVGFDSSAPTLYETAIKKNVDDGDYPFSSRVTAGGEDHHSGISKVSFKFISTTTSEVKKQHVFDIQPKSKGHDCPGSNCYCVRDECFEEKIVLEMNNCWLKVSSDRVKDEEYNLEIEMFNGAMLSTKRVLKLGKVDTFNGIQDYNSPSNVTVHKTTDTSLSIGWIQAPTCYERAGILLRLFKPDNTSQQYQVHKDATSYDLTGLSATTHYSFELYTKYGNDTHFLMSGSPATMKFVTAEPRFILLIIIIVIVLVVLGRKGKLQPAKARVTEGIRTIRNSVRVKSSNHYAVGFKNRACSSDKDDDIYFYGQMNLKSNNMMISRKDVAFEKLLTEGRFASIYLAKYYGNGPEVKNVVAKVLKDDQKEENVMKMKAKINFYTDKVGQHKNVMAFIGAVHDDQTRGPFMVIEYCENGVLKDFLLSQRGNASVELQERLFRLCFGICVGMDYLSSRKVVHRRLAARNILLDHLYEPKITGFGPVPDHKGDEDEKIPLKWMAPECQKSTKNATELSDVFSYGVVMWEILSLGETPYPGIQSRDVFSKQKQGYKMKKPEFCDDEFYKLMLKCWHYHPAKREGFNQIKDELNNMFTATWDDYYYMSKEDYKYGSV